MNECTPLSSRVGIRATMLIVSSVCLLSIGRAQRAVSPYAGEWSGTIAPITLYGLSDEVRQEQPGFAAPRELLIDISRDWRVSIHLREPRASRSRRVAEWRPFDVPWVSNQVGGEGLVVYGHIVNSCCTHTYMLNIARTAQDSLLVQWSWVANAVAAEPDDEVSKWAAVGYGEFKRVGKAGSR